VRIFNFTQAETLPYLILVVLVFGVLINNYKRGYQEVWSPLSIIALVFTYYCIIGPYQGVTTGDTFDRFQNMRPFYTSALWGAVVSFCSCVFGFHANRKTMGEAVHMTFGDEDLKSYGKKLFIIGFVLFSISIGGNVGNLLNPLDAEYVEPVGGSFTNYLALSLNFVIPGVLLLFVSFLRTGNGLLWFLIPLITSTGLFISLGFRYRIALLLGALTISYFLLKRKKPNVIILSAFTFLFIMGMGFIELTRQYNSGLNLQKLDTKEKISLYESGLKEARIFQTSGAVIDIVPASRAFVGFEPIIQTLLFPIPKALYPEKNSAEYLFSTLDQIYGRKYSKGAAFLMYGEHYLAFGWFGIFIGSFALGWIYKTVWIWYKTNEENLFVMVGYTLTVVFLYVIISRGYLPQVTMLFFFSVYPIFYIIRKIKRRVHAT
jgi:hypothetical protein